MNPSYRDGVYVKSSKGVDEIRNRTHRLGARQRLLLLLVDGRETYQGLAEKARAAGCAESLLRQLIVDGFIVATKPPVNRASAVIASIASSGSSGGDDILIDPSQRLTEAKALVLNCIRNNAGMWKARALNRAIDEAHSPAELFLTLEAIEDELRPIAGEALWKELQTKVRALIK
jgi:hypothetical protein